MEALSTLVREHQFLSQLVAAFEVFASFVERGADVDPADLRRFARALREFADETHREKEEHVLLPFLVHHGFDWDAPPLPQVCDEHSIERDLIAALDHAGARLDRWTDEERRHVAGLVRSLCDFQRKHHQTENEQLFPAIITRLDAAALEQLQSALERFDQHPAHLERRTAARDIGLGLIARYAEFECART